MAEAETVQERLREIAITAKSQGERFSFKANPLWDEAADLLDANAKTISELTAALEECLPFVAEYEQDHESNRALAIYTRASAFLSGSAKS